MTAQNAVDLTNVPGDWKDTWTAPMKAAASLLLQKECKNDLIHAGKSAAQITPDMEKTSSIDVSNDSPEMSNSDMKKMLKMQAKLLAKLESAEAEEAGKESIAANTRSSEKNKKTQKRSA